MWVGDPEAGRALLPALRSIGVPGAEAVHELVLPGAADPRRHHRGPRVPPLLEGPLPARAARRRDRGAAGPRPGDATLPGVSLQAYGGAIADVDDDATAFSHRAHALRVRRRREWSDPDEDDLRMGAARRAAAKLDPFAGGAYVNALSDEGASGVRRAYSDGQAAPG